MAPPRWDHKLQASLYVAAGVNHFWHPAMYRAILPAHYGHRELLVAASGVAEIAGGLGLLPTATRRFAAGGICLMLLVFLDVHQDMLRHAERYPGIPRWALWARIPLQFALMGWAYRFARGQRPA